MILWVPQLLIGLAAVSSFMRADPVDGEGDGMMLLMAAVLLFLLGGITFLVFMCQAGTSGKNRIGPDSKGFQGAGDSDDLWPDVA